MFFNRLTFTIAAKKVPENIFIADIFAISADFSVVVLIIEGGVTFLCRKNNS